MSQFIEIYTIETETYYVNVSQIKYFYVPVVGDEKGDKFLTIVLGDGKVIKSKSSLESFKKLLDGII